MVVDFPERLASDEKGLAWLAGLSVRGDNVDSLSLVKDPRHEVDPNLRSAIEVVAAHWRSVGKSITLPEITGANCLPYHNFTLEDIDGWADYVSLLMRHPSLPSMTEMVRERLSDGILELFQNAREHSNTQSGIYACGHYYSDQKRLRVSIADAGIGFKRRIKDVLRLDMSGAQAIGWAMTEGSTVKLRKDGVPGGIGLKNLKQFVGLNRGKLSVLSDDGYWEFSNDEERMLDLHSHFPGSVVTITVRTDDTSFYRMRSEVAPRVCEGGGR